MNSQLVRVSFPMSSVLMTSLGARFSRRNTRGPTLSPPTSTSQSSRHADLYLEAGQEAHMQRYQVTKVIEFAYGHRLLEHGGKCRYLHGHNGIAEVDIDSEQLDRLGMVIDFGDINEVVKKWI